MVSKATGDQTRTILLMMSIASPWSVDIALTLAARNLRVIVLTRTDPHQDHNSIAREGSARLQKAGIEISWPTGWHSWFFTVAAMALHVRHVAKTQNFHILSLYGGMQAMAVWLSCKRPHSIYWVGSDLLCQAKWKSPIIRMLAGSAQNNLVNGMHMKNTGEKEHRIYGLRNHYIGIDPQAWQSTSKRQPMSLICTRWFESIYANDIIVNAAAILQDRGLTFSLCFTSSGSLLPDIRKEAELLIPGTIEFLGGVDRDHLRDRLAAASIYVSMSQSDGTSTALLEALSIGLFPIISDIDANREWIKEHGCDGMLVPVDDPVSLADAIEIAINDPKRISEARQHNRKIVKTLADSRHNAAILADILKSESD
jgi:Glycosyl transferases group 1